MELRTYLKIIKKYWALAVLLPLVATFTAYYATKTQPSIYEGVVTLVVSSVPSETRENPPFYEYDGYYTIQSGQLFASTVTTWLTSPDVVAAIYKKADVQLEVKDVNEVRTKIRTLEQLTQVNSNSINAVIIGQSKEEAQKLALACADEASEKVEQFNQVSGTKVNYRVQALGEPVVIRVQPKLILNSIIAFISGVACALILIFFVHYFRKK